MRVDAEEKRHTRKLSTISSSVGLSARFWAEDRRKECQAVARQQSGMPFHVRDITCGHRH